jgi:hypothetical protein
MPVTTVNSAEPRVEYTATAGQTVFAYTFPVYAASELEVYQNTDGVQPTAADLLTLDTDYSVSGANTDGGGSVTLTVAASAGDRIVIRHVQTLERSSGFSAGGTLTAETLNLELNRLWSAIKQLDALMLPRGQEDAPTMDGDLNMGGFSITNAAQATTDTGLVTRAQAAAIAAAGVTLTQGDYVTVGTLAALQALAPSNGDVVQAAGRVTAGDGAAGVFRFDSSDLSTEVAADEVTSSQGDGGIYVAPASDRTGASGAWVRLYDGSLNVRWYGAAGDGATDDTAAIQTAIDAASDGGTVFAPLGTYVGNWTIRSGVIIQGEGCGPTGTVFEPALNDAVFKTPLDTSITRIGWRDLRINGDVTMNAQDGVVLRQTTASTFTDHVDFYNVHIANCGRYGVHLYGESNAGPFVQRPRFFACSVFDCVSHALFLEGAIFEGVAVGSFFVRSGDASTPNVQIDQDSGGSVCNRFQFIGCGLNVPTVATGTAIRIRSGRQVNLQGCSIENGNPCVHVLGNAKNVTLLGNNITTTAGGDQLVLIDSADGVAIWNNGFGCGSALTNYIRATTAITNVDAFSIGGSNDFGSLGNVTKAVDVLADTTIASGAIRAYRKLMYVGTESAAASDDLDNLYDTSGGEVGLVDGETVTLMPVAAAQDVVVKHNTGNIQLSGGADFTLGDLRDTITLIWSERSGVWREVGRSS